MSNRIGLRSSPIFLAWLFLGGIFILDAWFVDEGNFAFTYLMVIILGLFFKERNDVVLVGIIATVLTILAVIIHYQSENTLPLDQLLFGRVISLSGIWAGVFLVLTILGMRIEETLQDEQFHALFEYATSGIIITNNPGQIIRCNPAAEKLLGYSAGEIIGKPVEIFVPKRYSKSHESHRDRYRLDPHPRSMGSGLDLYAIRKDGTEFPVEISLSPFRTANGNFVMAFISDNTLRKESEQRILGQNQKLEQLAAELQNLNEGLEEKVRERTRDLELAKNDLAQALDKERELGELKSRFVSMASHEFRTPLSAILSSASLINSYAERADFEQIKKHGLRIKTAVNNLNTILTEFLSLGKLEEGKTTTLLQKTNLPEIVAEVISEIKPLLRPGQTFDYKHEGAEIAMLDPGLFKHILLNLFSNAIKYAPENTPILVLTRVNPDDFTLEVTDQGMGIPEADQKHLFSRFFRATNATNFQGTGLGLYIVKRYVELMNGEIGFQSEEGKGTTFRVQIFSTKN